MSEPVRNLDQDQETLDLLRDSAADFCQRSLDVTRLRSLRGATPPFDRARWREMCELGWSGILVDEAAGGLGLGMVAMGTVCRELGRVAAPEPLIECGVAAASLLGTAGADDALSALLGGDALSGCVLDGTVTASVSANTITLNGEADYVPLASSMDTLLVSIDDGRELALVAADADGLRREERPQSDGSSAAHLRFDHVAVLKLIEDVPANAVATTRDRCRLAAGAYLLGTAEALFDTTIEYLKTREQFGRRIGSFQALQHRAVDLFIQKTLAASVVEEALADYDAAASDEAREIAARRAKYRATEAALLIARQAVQLHGGIGYTDECDVGLYLNRVLVLAARYGNATAHARALADLLGGREDADAPTAELPAGFTEPANGDWDTIDDETFRAVVRRYFESAYPGDMRYPSRRFRWAEIKSWYQTLSAKGWVAPAWPAAHGGMGLPPSKLLIYIEEQERWGVGRAPDMGIQMVGPLLIRHGTEEQRQRYLPKILSGENVWCQGYSEPNAGSDLASLRTEAVADGDEFVINGQKTWTTLAQDATHMFCLARTSKEGKQQEGISFFLIDFDQPGITIRPIRNIAGDEEFCEVFLDNVRVPADCLVGEINQGWTIAKALLGFERIFIGSPKQSQYALMRLEVLADGAGLYDDAAFVDRLTRLKLDVLDLESTYQRFADIVRRGEPLGPDVSLLKIWGTETFARLSELMVEAAGAAGATVGKLDFGDEQVDVLSQFYNARPATIYGGSNEIQRNIISKGVLGLPS